jgi:hypothetical protein
MSYDEELLMGIALGIVRHKVESVPTVKNKLMTRAPSI